MRTTPHPLAACPCWNGVDDGGWGGRRFDCVLVDQWWNGWLIKLVAVEYNRRFVDALMLVVVAVW